MGEPVFNFINEHGIDEQGIDQDQQGGSGDNVGNPPATSAAVALGLLGLLAVVIVGWFVLARGQASTDEPNADQGPQAADTPPVEEIPIALRAAEEFSALPRAESMRALFDAVGGFEALRIGTAEGAFDVVSFDPLDSDQLLVANRAGYGAAENQAVNQKWQIANGLVNQTAWDRETPHDFVHYNRDGTITMWLHSGDEIGFAPRHALVIDRNGEVITRSSEPIYADRFAVDAGTVFALTGDPDWYSPNERHLSLIADNGERQVELAPGDGYAWIDNPVPGILIAYPTMATGRTAVWDTRTLESLDHLLAGRSYQRVAVSGDGGTAIGVNFDGELELLDLATGRSGGRFGLINVTEIERPLALSDDGTVAATVDLSGAVSIWFAGTDEPVATELASSGVPRWLPTSRSARLSSALAPDAGRVALRSPARPGTRLSWQLIDIDVDSWLRRACDIAGRGLSIGEREALGLAPSPGVCG